MERSGLGQVERLSGMGIRPRHRLAGVGENLQDHLQLRLIYKVSGVKTLNAQAKHWWGRAAMGLEYLLFRTGPLTMSPSQMGVFTRSSASVDRADLEYHIQPLSLERFGEPLHDFPAFTASVCHLRPSSRGSVHINHPSSLAQPQIDPCYLATDDDRQVAASAIRVTRGIVNQAPLAAYRPQEYLPGPQYESEEALVEAAGKVGTTIFHPVGTLKMGPASDPSAVVDAQLALPRGSRAKGGRCIGHADDYLGQYQRTHAHDCRACSRLDVASAALGFLGSLQYGNNRLFGDWRRRGWSCLCS